MVEGAPVFLTCQDQELLEVAKAVLREKFPQVKILGCAVCPSGPSMDGCARLDGRLGKIARLKPVFL